MRLRIFYIFLKKRICDFGLGFLLSSSFLFFFLKSFSDFFQEETTGGSQSGLRLLSGEKKGPIQT